METLAELDQGANKNVKEPRLSFKTRWQRAVSSARTLSPTDKLVLFGISVWWFDASGRGAWPSREVIADRLGVSVSTVDRAKDKARKHGFLDWSRRKHDSNIYVSLIPVPNALVADQDASRLIRPDQDASQDASHVTPYHGQSDHVEKNHYRTDNGSASVLSDSLDEHLTAELRSRSEQDRRVTEEGETDVSAESLVAKREAAGVLASAVSDADGETADIYADRFPYLQAQDYAVALSHLQAARAARRGVASERRWVYRVLETFNGERKAGREPLRPVEATDLYPFRCERCAAPFKSAHKRDEHMERVCFREANEAAPPPPEVYDFLRGLGGA